MAVSSGSVFFLGNLDPRLVFADFLNITEIKISGLDKLDETSVRRVVDDKLSGKYLGLVEKNNLILFSKKNISKELMGKFKRIESVMIEKKFPDEINIAVKERIFTMLLCSSEKCYVINERGEAYPADNFDQEELASENLITLIDTGNAQVSVNDNPLEDSFYQFILDLGSGVSKESGIILKRQYETPSRMSGDLKVETEEGWKIYFSESVGIEKELLMLMTVLEHKIEKEQRSQLEYIDLRIDNKVFYKFKDGVEQTQEAEANPTSEEKKDDKKGEKKKKD